jgi:HAD superfamily phosphatase (TIGR01668 family)
MKKLQEKGFKICFVSNNKKSRVDLFNRRFGFPAFAEAGKPLRKNMMKALEIMGLQCSQTAVIGDQLFTDVCAGKRINALSLLVEPIEPVETLFFKFKRALEKPFIKRYRRLNDENDEKNI